MQVAHVWLELNELGSNIKIHNVTPGEAVILRKLHGKKLDGQTKPTNPLQHVEILATPSKLDSETEYNRLYKKYGEKAVQNSFPGDSPVLPKTFKEVGFEETDETSPKSGKAPEIEPLPSFAPTEK